MKNTKGSIEFFKEDVRFRLNKREELKSWIRKIIKAEGKSTAQLNFIFCSDPYLLKMNKEYLGHNYFTDIITFDNSEEKEVIQGDLFISADRVKANALELGIPFDEELRRVMIHGVLHLCGYRDKNPKDISAMRTAEDRSLKKFKS